MPSIKSRIHVPVEKETTGEGNSGLPTSNIPVDVSSSNPLLRGFPPEQFTYDFQSAESKVNRPLFRRSFNIVNSINQNLALLAQSNN